MRRALAVVLVCAVAALPLVNAACGGTAGPSISGSGAPADTGSQATSGTSGSSNGSSGSVNGTSQSTDTTASTSGSSTNDSGTSGTSGKTCVNVDPATIPTACESDSDCTFGPTGLVCDGACCGYTPMNKSGLAQVEAATAKIQFGACPCAHPTMHCLDHVCAD